MVNIIGAIIALGILITVHEFGHFLAARFFRVEVEKFSLGFGPKLISFRSRETEFRISLIPLGGYIKMAGEDPSDSKTDSAGSIRKKTWWQRALITFSGPLANLLLGLLLFIMTFLIGRNYQDLSPIIGKVVTNEYQIFQPGDEIIICNGEEIESWSQLYKYTNSDELNMIRVQRDSEVIDLELEIDPDFWYTDVLPFAPAIVGEVSPGLPAYRAGLQEGDRIIAVDSVLVSDWYEMRELITGDKTGQVNLRIKRGEQVFEKKITLEENVIDNNMIIGITQQLPVTMNERFGLIRSIEYGVISTASFIILNYTVLYKMISRPSTLKNSIGGPVMIYTMSQQSAQKGWGTIISFIAAISLILMIMNLLPIPVLDGGHIFFCILEGIFRKPLSQKVQIVMQNIGLIILLSLMVIAFLNDFTRIFNRNSAIMEQKIEAGNR
ncbi:MAG: RIP metalloprotease RseP [Candidatus Cloacimonetes bacterium]|nr:RIP metalloprotease RseP [Candidatus Cloacimonadota bacterium]